MDRKLSRFLRKANKKNKPKKIINNKVLLIKSDYNTNYTHLKKNLSDFLYEKKEIDLNNISHKELIKEVISAKYIFIDQYNDLLAGFNFQEQITVFLGNKNGYYLDEITQTSELEQSFFEKITYLVIDSNLMQEYYQKKYNINEDQFLKYGYYLEDKFFSKRFELEASNIIDNYAHLLDKINVYLIGDTFQDNLSDEINLLTKQLSDEFKVYNFSNNYDNNQLAQQIYEEDYRFMFKFANVIIVKNNPIVFEMLPVNKNIKKYNNIDDLKEIINELNNHQLNPNRKEYTLNWCEYDNGMCCRNIINHIIK